MAECRRDRLTVEGDLAAPSGGTAAASGEPALARVGPLEITRLDNVRGHISLPGQEGGSRDRTSTILFLLNGRASLGQLGNHVLLSPGDASLLDHAVPYDLDAAEPSCLLSIRVPTRMLRDHLPSPEWLCARRLPGGNGMTGPIVAMIGALFGGGDALSEPYQLRVARHVLDLVATSYAIAFEAQEASSSIIVGRQAAVKLYIEQHLRDPGLTPCSISTNLRLSSRYLRLIFAANSETVSAYILRRRLEECAKQIADPRWRGHSMTEIAFAWGFNSAPHFTRSFRDRFATAPRDYRRAHLDGARIAA